ncbi:hypothetical protein ALQ04_03801 [Pseudomonas cichorii]|uniref:Permease n=1 Tax=Pseudomonas cichorii TaxID=36746 RepID=A0A3M4MAM9_PSECI|nr:permease [Pseudomonas cichorii]RMQ50623.1 hypothetical protein ALQ04_03801 [Pseudomonas cichorii]
MTLINTCVASQDALSSSDSSVMLWSIKTFDCSPKELLILHILSISVNLLPFLFCTWLLWDDLPELMGLLISFGCAAVIYSTYLIVFLARQKTVFNYHIKRLSGYLEYYDYYPNFAGPLFKGIAIFAMLLFLGVALFSGSLLFLIGPAAIALGAARFLLNWENKIHNEQSLPWSEHNFVTIDRKRSIIVIHCTDITTGFVAHLPSKELFEQYLQFLHSVLPSTAEFMEKSWEW